MAQDIISRWLASCILHACSINFQLNSHHLGHSTLQIFLKSGCLLQQNNGSDVHLAITGSMPDIYYSINLQKSRNPASTVTLELQSLHRLTSTNAVAIIYTKNQLRNVETAEICKVLKLYTT